MSSNASSEQTISTATHTVDRNQFRLPILKVGKFVVRNGRPLTRKQGLKSLLQTNFIMGFASFNNSLKLDKKPIRFTFHQN
jgi:hypothetical protein